MIKSSCCLTMTPKAKNHLQIRGEALIRVDDGVLSHVLFWSCPPEGRQLWPHVPALIIDVLVTRGHLLDGVEIHVNVCGGVRGIHNLPEGQYKASRCSLSKRRESLLATCQVRSHFKNKVIMIMEMHPLHIWYKVLSETTFKRLLYKTPATTVCAYSERSVQCTI